MLCLIFFSMILRPLWSTLFPYTTLFRSFSAYFPLSILAGLLGRFASFAGARFSLSPKSTKWDDGHDIRAPHPTRSEEHTSELQSRGHLVCRLLLEKKKTQA